MTPTAAPAPPPARVGSAPGPQPTLIGRRSIPWLRLAPTLVATALAAAYVIVSPPSIDLAAHLFRAQLFRRAGLALWNDYWYGGHDPLGYSVLFPAASAALSPQVVAAGAAMGTAALFERLAVRHYGSRAWLGALVFGAATAINLYTGRLALAFGALPALGAIVALDRRRTSPACLLAACSALCSPVAGLFAALAAGGCGLAGLAGTQRVRASLPAATVALAALAPVGALAIAFPEGGTEPFGLVTLLPLLAVAGPALILVPRESGRLRAGILVYAIAALACYLVPSPVGSNIARLGTFVAAPLAALLWWRRRPALLAMTLVPLVYIGWQAPVRDVATTADDPSVTAAYYRPLLAFLRRQGGVFRTEVPPTRSHWEAYRVASTFPIARGWERQLDIGDNPLFYRGRLTAGGYAAWLHRNAVRFVALPDAALDYSALREAALVRTGLPYLHLVMRSRHWRVYAVAEPTPLASGTATVTALSADALTLYARAPGATLVRVRYTPYWALADGAGCVAPSADLTRVTATRPGKIRLVIRFALGRIGSRAPRCTAHR